MPSPDSCVHCEHPFPANAELVSLPRGHRIAFEPAMNRVWRICTKCGEWNLLGAEAAAVSAAELSVLLGAATRVDEAPGSGLLRIGNLEVLRLDDPMSSPAVENQPHRSAMIRRRTSGVAVGMVGLLALGIAAFLYMALSGVEPGVSRWGLLPVVIAATWAAAQLGASLRGKRLLGRHSVARLVAAGVLAILGAAYALTTPDPISAAGLLVLSIIGITAFSVLSDRFMPVGRVSLPSGLRRWITRRELDETRLSWDEDHDIAVTLRNGTMLDGDDATVMLRELLDGWSWETADTHLEPAVVVAAGTDPLPRVLDLLQPALAASPDGVRIGALPGVYRAALDLALATRTGVTGKIGPLAARVAEAEQVASIAESLDEDRR